MTKLIRSEIGTNSNLVEALKNDIQETFDLSQAINNFITESKKDTGNGKVLDAEIWNNVRERFWQCLVSNNYRRAKCVELTNTINSSNKELSSYVDEAPIPEDPDTNKISEYKDLSDLHYSCYEYYCTHKTLIVGYWTDVDGLQYPLRAYDVAKQKYHYGKYELYKSQKEWLEKLVPKDNFVTYNVSSIDLSGMTVKAS